LLQKPQGGDDEAIAKATQAAAPELAAACYAAVDRRLALLVGALAARLCGEGVSLNLAEALEETIRHLDQELAGQPEQERWEAHRILLELRLEEQGLSPAELSLVLALREWLGQD
jgi:demethoxyubiquinone hydroxylase (CLK1/Coq7/Cat5 family)